MRQQSVEARRTNEVCAAEDGKFRVVLADPDARKYFPSGLGDFSSPEEAMEAADRLNVGRHEEDTESYAVYNDRGEVVVPERPERETLN